MSRRFRRGGRCRHIGLGGRRSGNGIRCRHIGRVNRRSRCHCRRRRIGLGNRRSCTRIRCRRIIGLGNRPLVGRIWSWQILRLLIHGNRFGKAGFRSAKAITHADGNASRIQRVVLVGDGTVKIRHGVVCIFHSRPPIFSHAEFRATSHRPGAIGGMKVACTVTGLGQAGKAEFGFKDRLNPVPGPKRAYQAALPDEELVIGRLLVSAQDHRVALSIDPEAIPDRCRSPCGAPPSVNVSSSPIARPIAHSRPDAQVP